MKEGGRIGYGVFKWTDNIEPFRTQNKILGKKLRVSRGIPQSMQRSYLKNKSKTRMTMIGDSVQQTRNCDVSM